MEITPGRRESTTGSTRDTQGRHTGHAAAADVLSAPRSEARNLLDAMHGAVLALVMAR